MAGFPGRDRTASLTCRMDTNSRSAGTAVIHDGEETLPFGDRLFAVPYHELWRSGINRSAAG